VLGAGYYPRTRVVGGVVPISEYKVGRYAYVFGKIAFKILVVCSTRDLTLSLPGSVMGQLWESG